jgi:hypothetical protein
MPCRIVAAGGVGLVEVGLQPLGADQTSNHLPRGGEVTPARLDPVVAAVRIDIAQGDDGGLAGERIGQGIAHEKRRLHRHFAGGLRRRGDAQGLRCLRIELVNEKIARHDGEIRARYGFREGDETRGQQGVVGVFTGSRHRLILGGGEGRLPCCRSRPRQGRGELRRLERIEMKIGDDDERAASLGAANRRDGRDQPGKGQGRGKGGQAGEKYGSSCHAAKSL